MLQYAWLVPLLPLAAAVIIVSLAKLLREKAAYVGVAAIGLSLALSIGIFFEVLGFEGHGPAIEMEIARWAIFGGVEIPMGIMVDNLAALTLLVVGLVSMMVQVYSIGYMHGDVRFTKYYAVLNLFTAGMLGLVIADNFFLLLVSWEIMGLCSYMLIGHWYEKKEPQLASMKAFLTTRVGDVGLMVGIWILFAATGTFKFTEIAELAHAGEIAPAVILTAAVLVFSGGVGKSAQFPLHTWLPDAMAGPTPASALIHAATMVAAGVYLVARAYGVFLFAPGVALEIVAVIGGFTALFAASIATLQTDIKKVLAYSTVSQLGYMMMALGAGGYTAGVFHLTTHAFFKSLLFLCSGSVIHAVHSQEMHEMGGLRKKMPITFWTWMIGTAALAGVPFFSGFFSKDEVLLAAYFFHPKYLPEWVGPAVFWGGMATAFLTAYYMTRATVLTFFGHPRDHHKYDHAHESPWSMALPLIILAVPAALAGWIGTSLFGLTNWIAHFIEFEGVKEHEPEKIVMWLAIASAMAGIAVGYAIYGLKLVNRKRIIGALKPIYVVVKNKYYVDEFYNAVFVKGAVKFSELVAEFDKWVVDGIVNAVGWFGYYWSMASGWFDKTVVDGLVNLTADATLAGGRQVRKISTGYVQAYMLTLVVMVVVGVIIFQVIGG